MIPQHNLLLLVLFYLTYLVTWISKTCKKSVTFLFTFINVYYFFLRSFTSIVCIGQLLRNTPLLLLLTLCNKYVNRLQHCLTDSHVTAINSWMAMRNGWHVAVHSCRRIMARPGFCGSLTFYFLYDFCWKYLTSTWRVNSPRKPGRVQPVRNGVFPTHCRTINDSRSLDIFIVVFLVSFTLQSSRHDLCMQRRSWLTAKYIIGQAYTM